MVGYLTYADTRFPQLGDRLAPPLKGADLWCAAGDAATPGSGGSLPPSVRAQLCLLFVRNCGVRRAHHCQLGHRWLSLLEQELGQGCCFCHLPALSPDPTTPDFLNSLLSWWVSATCSQLLFLVFPWTRLTLWVPIWLASWLANRNLVLQTRIAGWEQGLASGYFQGDSGLKARAVWKSPKGMNEVAKGFTVCSVTHKTPHGRDLETQHLMKL